MCDWVYAPVDFDKLWVCWIWKTGYNSGHSWVGNANPWNLRSNTVQTPVVGSESRVPEKETKLMIKTDLLEISSQADIQFCVKECAPYARDKQRAKCISSADTSGVLSLQVQTNSLQIAYGVPSGFLFLDLVLRS